MWGKGTKQRRATRRRKQRPQVIEALSGRSLVTPLRRVLAVFRALDAPSHAGNAPLALFVGL